MSEVLLDHRDLAFTGEVSVITGAAEVAQNIQESVAIPYGSLPWDREAGSHLWSMLNDNANRSETIAEIRRVMVSLPGVVSSSVRVRYDPRSRKYQAQFVPTVGGGVTVIDPLAAVAP